mgnify:CR=1 FL=1
MISIIVAISKNNVIGKNNSLPWYYPSDLQYFKKTTLNKKVVMGRKTFYSILEKNHKPLPNRTNIVVTRNKDFSYTGVIVIHNLIDFLKQPHEEEIFIIGGKEIYEQALPYVDRLYITHIDEAYEGDTYFPTIDFSQYHLISKQDDGKLSFCVYEKVK